MALIQASRGWGGKERGGSLEVDALLSPKKKLTVREHGWGKKRQVGSDENTRQNDREKGKARGFGRSAIDTNQLGKMRLERQRNR